MTGEEWPTPTCASHTFVSEAGQTRGASNVATPSRAAPRHCGHDGACATVIAVMATESIAVVSVRCMTSFIVCRLPSAVCRLPSVLPSAFCLLPFALLPLDRLHHRHPGGHPEGEHGRGESGQHDRSRYDSQRSVRKRLSAFGNRWRDCDRRGDAPINTPPATSVMLSLSTSGAGATARIRSPSEPPFALPLEHVARQHGADPSRAEQQASAPSAWKVAR